MSETCQSVTDALAGVIYPEQITQRWHGFFSEVLKISCTSCLMRHNLAVKVARSEPERREIAFRQELFQNEVALYQSISGCSPSLPAFVAARLDANNPILVLGWVEGTHSQFLSPAAARDVLHTYSALQTSCSHSGLTLRPRDTELHSDDALIVLQAAAEPMADDLRAQGFASALLDTAAWACDHFSEAVARVNTRVSTHAALLHGDFRADNMIRTRAGFSFLDWQRWSVGWAAVDVATFLSQSVTFRASTELVVFLSQAGEEWPSLELPSTLPEWRDLVLMASFGPIVGYRLSGLTDRERSLVRGSSLRALSALSALREVTR